MTIQVNSCLNLENNERVEKEFRNEDEGTWRIMKESTSLRISIDENTLRKNQMHYQYIIQIITTPRLRKHC